MSKKEVKDMQKKDNTASLQVNLQRCARPPEIHSAIMSAREFWCRRRIRSTDIIIIVMQDQFLLFYPNIP